MDKDIAALVNLPWATLLTLASGYAGYFIANVGLRKHQTVVDVTFSTLVFGFLGAFAYKLLLVLDINILAASAAAFLATVLIGAAWSRYGRRLLAFTLSQTRISHTDDLPNAWSSLFAVTDASTFQITVKLTDGTRLHCDDLRKFVDEPNGPCTLGGDGDLLLYVTDEKGPNDDNYIKQERVFSGWGSEITYIPKEQIARVELRRKLP